MGGPGKINKFYSSCTFIIFLFPYRALQLRNVFTKLYMIDMAKDTSQEKKPVRNDERLLAFERTLLSEERTLMSWVRTSLSLISFGFTIFRVFKDLNKDSLLPGGSSAAQNFGVILVILGTLFLIAASIQHKFIEKDLIVDGLQKRISLPFIAAICISLLGIVMLFGIFFKLGPLN